MEQEIISIALVPRLGHDAFFKLSNTLTDSLFHLDNKHLPHATIAQFIAPHTTLSDLNNELEGLSVQEFNINIAGLNFVPDFKRGHTWVELLVLKSKELLGLQDQILTTQFAKNYELQNWGTGDTYRPHITIGAIKGYELPGLSLGEQAELLRAQVAMKITAGKNGEYYTFLG